MSSRILALAAAIPGCQRLLLSALVGLLTTTSLGAQPHPEDDEVVDVELVLAVDVSLSMSPTELDIQRDGYAAALVHEQVLRAIQDGVHGKIAVTYFEWAGESMQHVVVPWTRISSEGDARAFVAQMTASPPRSARRTSISGALLYADRLFDDNGFRGLKRVIDVSGDGPNNQGEPVLPTRDDIVARGITINGLPLMTSGGFSSSFDVDNLDVYYQNCVIGGPGAFVIPVNEWAQFPEAIRRKLVLELASVPPAWPSVLRPGSDLPVIRVQAQGGYDCLVGERIWRDRSRYWDDN